MKDDNIFTNRKGCALIAAIDAGIVPKVIGGYDTTQFETFWALYERNLAETYRSAEATSK